MSLLLDALKKAAEQKAQKSKAETPAERGSDETLLDVAADVAARARPDDGEAARSGDETEFDHSELSARIESGSVVRGAADETALDLADITESRLQSRDPAAPSDEETGLDIAESTDIRHSQADESMPATGEDTGLDLPDATQTRVTPEPPVAASGDDTGLDIPDATQASFQQQSPPADQGDETGLEIPDATQTSFQQQSPQADQGDETGLEIPDATQTSFQQQTPQSDQGDETGLEIPDATQTSFQQQTPQADRGDETGLEIPDEDPDQDETSSDSRLSEQLQTGEDETMVFPSDDATNFVVEHEELAQLAAAQEDEIGSAQLDGSDLTGIGKLDDEPQIGDTGVVDELAEDEFEAATTDMAEDLTGISDQPESAVVSDGLGDDDDTQLRPDDPEVDARPQARDVADETDISQSAEIPEAMQAEDGDATQLGDPPVEPLQADGQAVSSDADQTDFREPVIRADQVEPAEIEVDRMQELSDEDETQEAIPEDSDSAINVADEDLSLLLLEPDPTNPRRAADTSFTSPQGDAERFQALNTGGLGLLDKTDGRFTVDSTDTQGRTVTNPSQTAIHGDETRVADAAETQSNMPRDDATSTRTYAPDNYDRTLMKLPSEDESKLFAGMKSDSDVVMTPDYAKKVFRSKTSVQRAQHYKLYIGIGAIILFSIFIYGGMQYQEESMTIDDSLRPLKRDPMPGLIKQQEPEETKLFAETGSDTTARTIEIIGTADPVAANESDLVASAARPESNVVLAGTIAGSDESTVEIDGEPELVAMAGTAPDAAAAVDSAPEMVDLEPTAVEQTTESIPVSEAESPAMVEPEAVTAPVAVADQPQADSSDSGQVALLTSAASDPEAEGARPANTANLQIKSSSQYQQNDVWLRDAYAAYQAGNDAQALNLYNKVLEVDPANRNALLARAAINVQNGNVNSAIKDYQALLLANPKDSVAMSSLLAVANISPSESESQLKLMIRDEPGSPYLNFALGNAYGAQDRWQDAQRHYFTALSTNPQDPNYAYNLAVSLEHISQPASAATYYQRALDNFDKGLATFSRELVNQRLSVLGAP